MAGLKYRFDRDLLHSVYAFHHTCLICGKNGADSFHHVKSSGSLFYKAGSFNSSILNACLIHNHGCHLYNPNLHKPETEAKLLQTILKILLREDYQLTAKDVKFYQTYEESYLLEI